MNILPDLGNRKKSTKLRTSIRVIVAQMKRRYPDLVVDIIEKEVLARITDLNFCEVTGFKLNHLDGVQLMPIDPYTKETVNINQVLLVHQQTWECWKELHKIIKETPDFIKADDYAAQLSLVQKTIRTKSKPSNLSPEPMAIEPLVSRSLIIPERIINLQNREANLEQFAKPLVDLSAHVRKHSFYSPRAIQRKIASCKERSKEKGLTCDLTFENAQHLFYVTHCQLTGLPLVKATKKQEDNPFGFSMDRINRFEGYNVSNLLIVAHEVNKIKSKLEWANYTESVENLREILTQTKEIMLKRHAHDNLHNRRKPLPIDTIINNYLSKDENHKKFVFE